MIRVIVPEFLSNLQERIILDIVRRSFRTESYTKEVEPRKVGRFIKVINDDNNEIHYVCLSNPENDSRNAHLMQFISPAYVEYWSEPNENKCFDIYIINPDKNDRTTYIKLFYRCFITIGIKILNWESLGLNGLVPFTSYEELKNSRSELSDRNSHNQPTYFIDESESGREQISLYGKTFGANAMESFIFAITLSKICDKPIVFYPVVDNDSKSLSTKQQQVLIESGIRIGEVIEVLPNGRARLLSTYQRETSRDTIVFHYNLLQKYGEKRCYICGCDIEHMVIGSHIERVTDIDHNKDYNEFEKTKRATDGDNGFWLCANHDKMFEYGIIYFADREMKIGAIARNQTDKDFIEYSTKANGIIYPTELSSVGNIEQGTFSIKPEHYNNSIHEYLEKHRARITSIQV